MRKSNISCNKNNNTSREKKVERRKYKTNTTDFSGLVIECECWKKELRKQYSTENRIDATLANQVARQVVSWTRDPRYWSRKSLLKSSIVLKNYDCWYAVQSKPLQKRKLAIHRTNSGVKSKPLFIPFLTTKTSIRILCK